MSASDAEALEQQLLDHVPDDGSSIGNYRLMRTLRWRSEDDYWEVRNRLVDRGVLETGRGRGGSVRRTITPATETADEVDVAVTGVGGDALAEAAAPHVAREQDLYEPMARVLRDNWVKDKRFDSAILRITANQGSKATGGKWTRPDITVATLATYSYVPGRHFDVITFEIKPPSGIDVTAVYEALAHLRCATRAYVLLHVPDDQKEGLSDAVIEVSAEAKRHGVGVITVGDPSDYDAWDELVEPVRTEPEPQKLNEFLAKQFEKEELERLVRWFR